MLVAALACWACAAGVLVIALIGCGSGDGPGLSGRWSTPEPLSPSLAALYSDVESCVGTSRPAPLVAYEPTSDTPETGRHCCLAYEPIVECAGGHRCCYSGLLYEGATVILPDECHDAAAHEFVHYLTGSSAHGSDVMMRCEGARA